MTAARVIVAVLAHNEERRIGACLESLPLGAPGIEVHVIVNGSSDETVSRAKTVAGGGAVVHDYAEGGKARSWNRFIFDELGDYAETHVFVDGDAAVAPGSIEALARTLADHPDANAASGLPLNGRRANAYSAQVVEQHGLFGDLYALRGSFLAHMRSAGVRLPDDVIGEDSLIGALAKTDLGPLSGWREERVTPSPQAGFYCEPASLAHPRTWRMQYRRMINYSVRHFQNQMIAQIMRTAGPKGLPRMLASLYGEALPQMRPRPALSTWWFDRLALARMRHSSRP